MTETHELNQLFCYFIECCVLLKTLTLSANRIHPNTLLLIDGIHMSHLFFPAVNKNSVQLRMLQLLVCSNRIRGSWELRHGADSCGGRYGNPPPNTLARLDPRTQCKEQVVSYRGCLQHHSCPDNRVNIKWSSEVWCQPSTIYGECRIITIMSALSIKLYQLG